jgi:protease-4
MDEKRGRRRWGCLWAVLAVAATGAVAIGASALIGRRLSAPGTMGEDQSPALKEVWAWGTGETKVVVVPLKGLIMLDRQSSLLGSAAGTADQALRAIRRATCDDSVEAIILEVDSGGGGITASDILYEALLDFRDAQAGRRIVAVFNDMAASGAYYVALAADHIVAHPTTITGSIGVLIESFNIRELGQKIGLKDVTIKSGANKDLLNPLGDLSDEQRRMLQGIVDELHGRFLQLVVERRQLPEEQVREIADGRIFTAGTALDLRLVDQVGYWEDAVDKTAELLKVQDVKVFRYEEHFSLAALLKATQDWSPASAMLLRLSQVRFLYLWRL